MRYLESSFLARALRRVIPSLCLALLPVAAFAQSNPIVAENQNAGTTSWDIEGAARATTSTAR